jgi:two-component system, NarL family, response regulator LiaR
LAFDDLMLYGEATNGADAIMMCDDTQPDVILMDFHMPEMDGLATTQAIHTRFPNIKIIILSNYISQIDTQDVLAAGAVRCISKSVEGRELADVIRSAKARPSAA